MSIATEIKRLQDAKQSIKQSIINKGVAVEDAATLDTYASKIDEISGGGGDDTQTLIDLIEKDITSINIPQGTTTIGNYAFSYCSSLRSVTIPNSVTSIDNSAFQGCSSLTSVTIPNSVTNIGYYAFESCTSLTSVTISNSVTSIGDQAFFYCTSLTSVTIPNSVTSIGYDVFSYCTSLTDINYNGTIEEWNAITKNSIVTNDTIVHCTDGDITIEMHRYISTYRDGSVKHEMSISSSYKTNLVSVEITNISSNIPNNAFSGCTNLTSVTMPNSITSIGSYVFYNCTSLTNVNYNGEQAQWGQITKGSSWKNGVPSTCIVHCTDGDRSL